MSSLLFCCLIILFSSIASARRVRVDSAAEPQAHLPSQCVTPPPFTIRLPTAQQDRHHDSNISPSALHYHTSTSTLYLVSTNHQQVPSIYVMDVNDPQPTWTYITSLAACSPSSSDQYSYGGGGGIITHSAFYESSENSIMTWFVLCAHHVSHRNMYNQNDHNPNSNSQLIQPKSLQVVNIEMDGINSITHTITSIDITTLNCTAPYIRITPADASSVYLMCTSPSTCSTIYHITPQTISIVTDSLQCPSPRSIVAYTPNVIYAACYDASAVEKGTGRLGNGWIARIDRGSATAGMVGVVTNSTNCMNPSFVSMGSPQTGGVVHAVCSDSSAISIDPSNNHAVTQLVHPSECMMTSHFRTILSNPSLGLTYLLCFGQQRTSGQQSGNWMLMKRDDKTGILRQVVEPSSTNNINMGINLWSVEQSQQGRIFIFSAGSIYVIPDTNKSPPAVP